MLKFARVGDLEIAYRQVGHGPPLLMLHGMEGDHRVFSGVQDALADLLCTIAIDQRDCGASRWLAPPTGYAILDIAQDVIRLMDGLGLERASLLGNSAGGLVAQHLAANWPDRVDRLVLGLTWPGTGSLEQFDPAGPARRRELAALGPGQERLVAELFSTPAYVTRHPEILDWLLCQKQALTEAGRSRRFDAIRSAPAVDPRDIRSPALTIAAAQDGMVPPHVVGKLTAALPQATSVRLENVGHLAAVEDPQQFASALRAFFGA